MTGSWTWAALAMGVLFAIPHGEAALPLDVPASTPVSNITFVAFDTETTGLQPDRDRVVEIAAVKFRGTQIMARCSWRVNPGMPIPAAATRIHGITDAMVSNCPPFAAVFPSFAAFAGGSVLLAHNAGFDRRFVAGELKRHALAAPSAPILDSMVLFRAWFPGRRSFALESLTTEVLPALAGAPVPAAGDGRDQRFHTAGWDAECLMALFVKGATNLPAQATLQDLLRLAGGAYAFGAPRRQWRPGAAQSSSEAAPDALAP